MSVRELAPRRWVVDVGQNISGWVRLAGLGPAGTEITLTYGEWLDHDGDVTQDHVAYPASTEVERSRHLPGRPGHLAPASTATCSSRGTAPRASSTCGSRATTARSPPTTSPRSSCTPTSSRIGGFECSDERINALHRIAEWSFRDNACDIPTDCPTRERAGWTGDWQIFVETAAFLYDVAGFSVKWLRDLAAEQRPDGKVTNLVPESHPGDDRPPGHLAAHRGLRRLGRRRRPRPLGPLPRPPATPQVLADQWASAQGVGRLRRRRAPPPAATRHGSQRSAEPAPHERYLWDSGWHFGEWLEAGETLDDAIAAAMVADHGPVATAYLHRSAAAARRDRPHPRQATTTPTATPSSPPTSPTRGAPSSSPTTAPPRPTPRPPTPGPSPSASSPTTCAPRRPAGSSSSIRDAGNHLTTGFLATPFLLPVLADTGHLDVAYDLLFQDTEPSWLVMVDRGATTVWEEWGGVDADGVPHASLNHYSKGAVITFLHQYVAGLQLVEPGYRRFRVAPRPGGGITWAQARTTAAPTARIEVAGNSRRGRPPQHHGPRRHRGRGRRPRRRRDGGRLRPSRAHDLTPTGSPVATDQVLARRTGPSDRKPLDSDRTTQIGCRNVCARRAA